MHNGEKKKAKKLTLNVETIRNISDLGTGNAHALWTTPKCTDATCFTDC